MKREKSLVLDKPFITIVTVVFNGVVTLEQTIKSVINQTYKNREYIIIDGGSTDGTLDIIKKYKENIDYCKSEPDSGIYDAMNKALKVANGDYIIFMGADDLFFSPYVLEKVSKYLIDEKCVYYGNSYFATNHRLYDGEFSALRLAYKNICHQGIFYPKILYKAEQYNLKYKILADYDYNIRAYKKNKFVYIPLEISNYYDRGKSSCVGDKQFSKDKLYLVLKNLGVVIFLVYFPIHYVLELYITIKRKWFIKA